VEKCLDQVDDDQILKNDILSYTFCSWLNRLSSVDWFIWLKV